jgi:hypothetical protein
MRVATFAFCGCGAQPSAAYRRVHAAELVELQRRVTWAVAPGAPMAAPGEQ